MYSCLHPCLKCVVWVINDDKQKNKAVKDWKNSDFCSQRNLPVRLIMIGKYIKKKGRKCKCYYTKLTKVKKWWKLFTHLKRKKKKEIKKSAFFSLRTCWTEGPSVMCYQTPQNQHGRRRKLGKQNLSDLVR